MLHSEGFPPITPWRDRHHGEGRGQRLRIREAQDWIPACAGMTAKRPSRRAFRILFIVRPNGHYFETL
jgi:hypothetical protein